MNNQNLSNDFENTTNNLDDLKNTIENVLGEADKYITFLESKYALLDDVVSYLNTLSDSKKNETKDEILKGINAVFERHPDV